MVQLWQRVWLPLESMERLMNRLQCTHSFSKSTKEVLNIQGLWGFQNTTPTKVHHQVFHIITWQLPMERSSLIHHQGACSVVVYTNFFITSWQIQLHFQSWFLKTIFEICLLHHILIFRPKGLELNILWEKLKTQFAFGQMS